ncbi:MAG: RNA 2',3'-cyclic phosphodiesterase [archaeon]
MRLFIAADVSSEIKEYIMTLQAGIDKKLGKFTLVRPESMHLTLKFLGEVPESKIEGFQKLLSEIEFPEFTLTTSKIRFFPNENYIRVVVVEFEDCEAIKELWRNINNKLHPHFKRDKDFIAHLTLARVKFISPENKEKFLACINNLETKKLSFKVDRFKLYQSTLLPTGPIYNVLDGFRAKKE